MQEMAHNLEDLSEFLIIEHQSQGSSNHTIEVPIFDRQKTLYLLSLYKKYKAKLGTYNLKTMKKVWEDVADDMTQKFKVEISGPKCENRFKVLERNYKRVMDNNNRTGRARKLFEYQNEFDDMYSKKVNINPQILLSSDKTFINSTQIPEKKPVAATIVNMVTGIPDPTPDEPGTSTTPQQIHIPETDVRSTETTKTTIPSKKLKKQTYKKRNDIFIEMKNDLKQYYDHRIKTEQEKLSLAKEKRQRDEKKVQLLEQYVKELGVFNANHRNECNKCNNKDSSNATYHPL